MMGGGQTMMGGGQTMMMWDGQTTAGGGWLMFLGLILVTALVVMLVVFLTRQTTHPSGPGIGTAQAPPALPPTPDSPREILKRRYAAGEIDREDYLKRLSDL